MADLIRRYGPGAFVAELIGDVPGGLSWVISNGNPGAAHVAWIAERRTERDAAERQPPGLDHAVGG
jgi:hypothetical protein